MLEINQAWWHVEDHIRHTDGKRFKIIFDLRTNNVILPTKLIKNYVKLKIKSKYHSKELPFTIKDNCLIDVHLGELSNWPLEDSEYESEEINESEKIRRIYLEVEYMDIEPEFERRRKFNKLFGYESSFVIQGFTQPEFSITLPKGLRLGKEWVWQPFKNRDYDTNIIFSKKPKRKRKKEMEWFWVAIRKTLRDKKKQKEKEIKEFLEFHRPNVQHKNGKNTYNFLITQDSYKKVQDTDPKRYNVNFLVVYSAVNESRYFFITIFSFLFPSVLIMEYLKILNLANLFASLAYLSGLIAFLTLYLALHREGYEIPLDRWIMYFIPISLVLFLAFNMSIYLGKF